MGQPASMAATRLRYASLVSVGITLPITTWPTASGAMPARWMAAFTAVVAKLGVGHILQAAAEGADGGAGGADDEDVTVGHEKTPEMKRGAPWLGKSGAGGQNT